MTYQPLTPFRRALNAEDLIQLQEPTRPLPSQPVNKWDILRDLAVARRAFGLSDRTLVVLQALLSFHPETELGGCGKPLIVFPSNATICARLNGMPCSTMRRHVAALVSAGIIQRRDSPNGKRFIRRRPSGEQAFGFDLTPLLVRASEITEAADDIRTEEAAYQQQRQTVSLMRRDLAALVAYAEVRNPGLPLWDQLGDLALLTARALRRKLSITDLQQIADDLGDALLKIKAELSLETTKVSSNAAENEQHHQNSKKEFEDEKAQTEPQFEIPMTVVLENCRELQSFVDDDIYSWRDFLSAAEKIRPMMGLDLRVWRKAVEVMGKRQAASVLSVMLERFGEIRAPGAYLSALTLKAEKGEFSCIPMVLALNNRRAV
ncbi:MAG: plasmid replication protein RepC [Sulfitobacter sp.]